MNHSWFQEAPIIGILRGLSPEQLPQVLEAATRGGLRNVEVTMNSPNAAAQIRAAVRQAGARLNIGAGTVTSLPVLHEALAAGATFIVTPLVHRLVIIECVRQNIPVFPGAFSPTEIWEAWELGAAMVKVFPADAGGPGYLKALRGPFPQVKLLPTGGVDLQTAAAFLKAGAAGLGVGSPLFDKPRIDAGDWAWLERQTRQFVETVRAGQRD